MNHPIFIGCNFAYEMFCNFIRWMHTTHRSRQSNYFLQVQHIWKHWIRNWFSIHFPWIRCTKRTLQKWKMDLQFWGFRFHIQTTILYMITSWVHTFFGNQKEKKITYLNSAKSNLNSTSYFNNYWQIVEYKGMAITLVFNSDRKNVR